MAPWHRRGASARACTNRPIRPRLRPTVCHTQPAQTCAARRQRHVNLALGKTRATGRESAPRARSARWPVRRGSEKPRCVDRAAAAPTSPGFAAGRSRCIPVTGAFVRTRAQAAANASTDQDPSRPLVLQLMHPTAPREGCFYTRFAPCGLRPAALRALWGELHARRTHAQAAHRWRNMPRAQGVPDPRGQFGPVLLRGVPPVRGGGRARHRSRARPKSASATPTQPPTLCWSSTVGRRAEPPAARAPRGSATPAPRGSRTTHRPQARRPCRLQRSGALPPPDASTGPATTDTAQAPWRTCWGCAGNAVRAEGARARGPCPRRRQHVGCGTQSSSLSAEPRPRRLLHRRGPLLLVYTYSARAGRRGGDGRWSESLGSDRVGHACRRRGASSHTKGGRIHAAPRVEWPSSREASTPRRRPPHGATTPESPPPRPRQGGAPWPAPPKTGARCSASRGGRPGSRLPLRRSA